ncbi:MAG: hypothetical protein AB8B91_15505 [Rubripirellula sp.]
MSFDHQPLAKVHFERNQITRADWEAFAGHRQSVSERLLSAGSGREQPSLCVLGAGNGNDLDLPLLVEHFQEITLVDLDRSALSHCLSTQSEVVARKIKLESGVDLSGILDQLDSMRTDSALIDLAIERMNDQAEEAQTYDVVASTCLLTQMIDSVVSSLGADHPRFVDLVYALRDYHLRLLCRLTRPGGTGLIVTDFVSSDTLPGLFAVPDQQLTSLLGQAIASGNFFTGAKPSHLLSRLQTETVTETPLVETEIHSPWRWRLGSRVFAVCAVSFRKP